MFRFIFNRAFQIGFWVAMVSFALFNLLTLTTTQESRVRHYVQGYGFPVAFYEFGGDPYFERFSTFGIVVDLSVAFVYSFITGALLSYFWIKDLRKTRDEMTGNL